MLFKAAAPQHYKYYHLLSGIDLPLKTQNEVHAFFDENNGKNYIDACIAPVFEFRVRYYHFFRNITGRSTAPIMLALRVFDTVCFELRKYHQKAIFLVILC